MKTNTYKILILVALLTVVSTSCNEDSLSIDPTDQYSIETFWRTEEHASAGLSGCYQSLRNFYGGNWVYETDVITPNGWGYNENGGVGPLARGVHITTDGLIASKWNQAYQGVGRANTFLDNIGNIPMDETLKSRMTGEAKFLRALFYFNLVNYFGDVPLILATPDAETQSDLPRTDRAAVVSQILTDLDDAAAVLPPSYPAKDIGRVTVGAALALKARLQLYEEDWAGAAQSAQAVMDLQEYSLFPNYRELFKVQNENNEEVIFNVEFLAPRFMNNFDQPIYILNTPAPLKDLVDAYLADDGLPIDESPSYDPANPYENRDPRLHQTIAVIGYQYNGRTVQLSDVVNTGFGLKKWTSFSDDVNTPIVPPSTDLNPILIRYAEVLLTYAEARNEASGPDQSVYDAINAVRARPSVDMPPVEAGLSKDEMREVIRLERRIELAFEGLYYADIRRWKTAEVVNNGAILNYEGQPITIRTFDRDRDYLWPIPYVQIQENPALEQNPNYH